MQFSLLCICLGFRIGFRIGLRMRCRIGFEMVERFKNDPKIGDSLGGSARRRQKTQHSRAMPYKKNCYFEALHPYQTLPNHSKSLPEQPPRAPKSSKRHPNDPRDAQETPNSGQETPKKCLRDAQEYSNGAQETPIASKIDFACT